MDQPFARMENRKRKFDKDAEVDARQRVKVFYLQLWIDGLGKSAHASSSSISASRRLRIRRSASLSGIAGSSALSSVASPVVASASRNTSSMALVEPFMLS